MTSRSPKPTFVLWLTGLPCSGKTTIADEVARRFQARSISYEQIDGDAVRQVLKDNEFGIGHRERHVRNIGWAASLLARHGVVAIVSLVSPTQSARTDARQMANRFVEVYLSTPLDVCERRDVKGMYKRARAGDISQFTGVSSLYEAPTGAEVAIDTSSCSVAEAADRIFAYLKAEGLVDG